MSLSKLSLRIGTSLLLATAPLMLLASGCGGGGNFTPLPTFGPTPTATSTGVPGATATSTPVPTTAPTSVGTTALEFSSLGTGFDSDGTIYEQGWRFTTNRALSVTALGFYDQQKNGLSTSHRVGIFDVSSQALVASTTVAASDSLTGFFRFHALTTPVTLTSGRDYYIMAVLNSASDGFASGVSSLAVNSALTFKGSASNTAGSQTGALVYPDAYQSFNSGNFGPTFRFN